MILLLASVGWGLLGAGAAMHIWRHGHLRELLALHLDHERIPAVLITCVEVALSVAIPITYLTDSSAIRLFGVLGVLVALGFVAWIARLLASGSSLPCACSFSRAPTTRWSLARAGCVLLVGLFMVTPTSTDGALSVATMLVGASVAAAIFVTPEALSWPTASRAVMARLDTHAGNQPGGRR